MAENINCKNYFTDGGDTTIIGGVIDVVTGGALKIAGTAMTKTSAQLNALPIVLQAAVADVAAADSAAAVGAAPIKAEYDVVVAEANETKLKLNVLLAKLRLANIITP